MNSTHVNNCTHRVEAGHLLQALVELVQTALLEEGSRMTQHVYSLLYGSVFKHITGSLQLAGITLQLPVIIYRHNYLRQKLTSLYILGKQL